MTVEVAKDLVLKLIHAPGESQDQESKNRNAIK